MLHKDQFGIVFNTIFAIMFAIFLPMYIDGSNMYRETGMVLWGPCSSSSRKISSPPLR